MNSREMIVVAAPHTALKDAQCWGIDTDWFGSPRLARNAQGVEARLLAVVLAGVLCAPMSPLASSCDQFTLYSQPAHASIGAAQV